MTSSVLIKSGKEAAINEGGSSNDSKWVSHFLFLFL